MSVKKIISISLYGPDATYLNGLIENLYLAPEIYPGWTVRVYTCVHDMDVSPLREFDCEIISKPRSKLHSGMFWRFLSAWDTEAERVIFRDADSRLNAKEAFAVKAWEKSGLVAHCMMDHPHHSIQPVSGGMWGIKCGILSEGLHREVLKMCRERQPRVKDMHWIRDKVHPLVSHSLLRHSSVKTKWPSVPFPEHPEIDGFIGQQYTRKGEPVWPEVK